MSQMFDKRFVHFMWDDSLKGKVGFFADSMSVLKFKVEHNDEVKKTASAIYQEHLSFLDENDTAWKFFYYDPLYEYRWVHEHEQGKKKVQVKLPLSGWSDMPKDWAWDYGMEYRIVEEEEKPTRLNWYMLAMWLAKGNGQAHSSNLEDDMIITSLNYNPLFGADTLDNSWQVRRWDDTEWHEPTLEYCFPEVRVC